MYEFLKKLNYYCNSNPTLANLIIGSEEWKLMQQSIFKECSNNFINEKEFTVLNQWYNAFKGESFLFRSRSGTPVRFLNGIVYNAHM